LAEKYPEAGARWDIVGGRINPGQTLDENLRREIKEETQIEFNGRIHLVGAQDILRVPGKHVVRLTYIGEIEGEPTPILDEENDAYQWVTRDELLKVEPLDIYVRELLDSGNL
jgi:A/G-specific adenine glycosylase